MENFKENTLKLIAIMHINETLPNNVSEQHYCKTVLRNCLNKNAIRGHRFPFPSHLKLIINKRFIFFYLPARRFCTWRSAAQNKFATTPHTYSKEYNTNKIHDDESVLTTQQTFHITKYTKEITTNSIN
jgi:hypothetical protein